MKASYLFSWWKKIFRSKKKNKTKKGKEKLSLLFPACKSIFVDGPLSSMKIKIYSETVSISLNKRKN
jgi:hypothetical protein